MTHERGNEDFSGKVAVITGAGQGIGHSFAVALTARGASVAILDLDGGLAKKAAGEVSAEGGRAAAFTCDVADDAAVGDAVAACCARFGGVDILINCAGMHLPEYSRPPTQLALHKWRRLLDVNIMGIVHCSAHCHEPMRQRGGGVIINISSGAGYDPVGAYGVSKLAVRGLTTALAAEFADDAIRVCGIAPGMVDSPSALAGVPAELAETFVKKRQLIKRPGRMQDLVGPMLFLCSADASWITGETLIVGGGYPLRS